MAGINLTVHLEYDEVVERLKAEGWAIPVRCRDCRYYLNSNEKCELIDTRLQFYSTDKMWTEDSYCAWGERKGGADDAAD